MSSLPSHRRGIRDNSENRDKFNLIQQIKGKPREKTGSIWYAHGILIDKTSRQKDFYISEVCRNEQHPEAQQMALKNGLFTSESQWELSPFKITGTVSSYQATTSKGGEFAFTAFPLVYSKFSLLICVFPIKIPFLFS